MNLFFMILRESLHLLNSKFLHSQLEMGTRNLDPIIHPFIHTDRHKAYVTEIQRDLHTDMHA